MTNDNRQQKKVVKKRSSSLIPPHLAEEKQDNGNTIEESQDVLQEEVGIISGKHIVIMIYAYGGFVPSTFQKIEVYTSDKFIKSIIKKGKTALLLQCLESLA